MDLGDSGFTVDLLFARVVVLLLSPFDIKYLESMEMSHEASIWLKAIFVP